MECVKLTFFFTPPEVAQLRVTNLSPVIFRLLLSSSDVKILLPFVSTTTAKYQSSAINSLIRRADVLSHDHRGFLNLEGDSPK